MIIEDSDALKSWLTSCLAKLCDADPAALAKYVMALVKKDKPENDLKAFCLDQLDVFLMKETKNFVDLLFETLKNKSYLTSTNIEKTASSPTDATNVAVKVDNPEDPKVEKRFKDAVTTDPAKPRRISLGSRGRSRSRSPLRKSVRPRSRSRENEDKYKRYPSDEERKRGFPSRKRGFRDRRDNFDATRRFDKDRSGPEVGAEKNNDNRSRSRSPSWGKHRSRSHSWSSHSTSRSRSRSRGRSKERKADARNSLKNDLKHCDHGDKDYRVTHPRAGAPNSNHYGCGGKGTKRCQDYDEKGYCMRGDLCLYDHGTDPLVVDDVSVLNFGVSVSKSGGTSAAPRPEKKSPSLPPLPSSPPPLPPPPPPLPPAASPFVPEPYNPEAPGMNLAPREPMNYWPPPVHHPPPLPHQAWPPPPPPPGIPGVVFNINEPPPNFHHMKLPRARELIGVPTLDKDAPVDVLKGMKKDSGAETPRKVFLKPSMASSENIPPDVINDKRRSFDFNRLGQKRPFRRNFNTDRCTLEIRKIPRHLNSIAMLNSHFCKFGRIINIQVIVDNDPEAALVQFSNHSEALAAYRSTDAVLNNRFIKVFWHNKDKANIDEKNSVENSEPAKKPEVEENSESQKSSEKQIERSVVLSSKGNISRTIFNPAALKKNNVVTPVSVAHLPKEIRKEALRMKIEIHKKKQEYLKMQVEHEKVMIEKLGKAKNNEERDFLKKSIKDMDANISKLQAELKKDSEDLKKLAKTINVKVLLSKTETEKELLDAEMDLYRKQCKGDDTTDLLSKVNELKQKAKALGLIDNFGARSRVVNRIRRGATRFLGRNHAPLSRTVVDHRTRKLVVSGTTDKDGIQKHFSQFGELESVYPSETGCVVMFKTRKEAETALSLGCKYGDAMLTLSWLDDARIPNTDSMVQQVAAGQSFLEEDEEEDEDDTESRLWRR